MNTILEGDLAEYARSNAIKRLHIVQLANGHYKVEVELSWKEGKLTLITQRKEVKEWANLQRLATHISTSYGAIKQINLVLLPQS